MPTPVENGFGRKEIDCRVAGTTVTVALPDIMPELAVIDVDPTAIAVTKPVAAFTEADA
jgi:hypothetical protein